MHCALFAARQQPDYQKVPGYYVYDHTGFVALLPYIEEGNLFKAYAYWAPSSTSTIPLREQYHCHRRIEA